MGTGRTGLLAGFSSRIARRIGMIKLIQGTQRREYAGEFDAMHRLRKQVYYDRLNWDVTIAGDHEIDKFDDLNPLYLISLDAGGQVRGSARLLPSTGANTLGDMYPWLLPDCAPVESATIWEFSRFCVDPAVETARARRPLDRVTGDLLSGIVEVGILVGLTNVVALYDALVARILKRANCAPTQIGNVVRIGGTLALAGLLEISEQTLENLRVAAGITESVLEPKSVQALGAAA
jgi:acyl homoserine lactone synthase